ncbi:MAG: hypothetical protein ACLU6Y_09925 [Ruminococcus sp.]
MVAGDSSETAVFSEDGTPVKKTVKAADINMNVQDSYDFPFLGLKAVLPEELKKQWKLLICLWSQRKNGMMT